MRLIYSIPNINSDKPEPDKNVLIDEAPRIFSILLGPEHSSIS